MSDIIEPGFKVCKEYLWVSCSRKKLTMPHTLAFQPAHRSRSRVCWWRKGQAGTDQEGLYFPLCSGSTGVERLMFRIGERYIWAPCEERGWQGRRLDDRPQERRKGHQGPGKGQARRCHLCLWYVPSVALICWSQPLTESYLPFRQYYPFDSHYAFRWYAPVSMWYTWCQNDLDWLLNACIRPSWMIANSHLS